MTIDVNELKNKLKEIYPEIEKYNLQMQVKQDQETNSWLVTFSKGEESLSTHIEYEDVEKCLEGKECFHLGVELGRFIRYYCDESGACQL